MGGHSFGHAPCGHVGGLHRPYLGSGRPRHTGGPVGHEAKPIIRIDWSQPGPKLVTSTMFCNVFCLTAATHVFFLFEDFKLPLSVLDM